MSYLGFIPQTTRTTERHVATLGTNAVTLTTLTYDPAFLDVYVNGTKIELTVYPGNAHYYEAIDSTHVTVHGCVAGDILEFVSYSTLYVGGGSGGALSLTDLTADLELIFNSSASAQTVNMFIDGGTF